MKTNLDNLPAPATRRIATRTQGRGHGIITRLMSPSDLGQIVKPFVFLDIFDAKGAAIQAMGNMPIHPHSGIATVTVFTKGTAFYNDPAIGSGTLRYGGVEWAHAGGGMWHGKELKTDDVPHLQGFQLWIALPSDLENSASVSHYIEDQDMGQAGPAYVILGSYEGVQSPVPAPQGINYLLVTLRAGERWTYHPPVGQAVGWLAVAQGALASESSIRAGEMVVFEPGEKPIVLEASQRQDAVFVLGSAVAHPHPLHLGNYSVHTNPQALDAGERRIAELARKMKEAGDRKTDSGTIPVFR